MSSQVFFCGEVVVDMLEHTPGSGEFKLMLGGSHFLATLGAAKAIVRDNLSVKASFVGTISTDMFGDRFIEKFENMGISTAQIKRVDKNSTLALVAIRPGLENAFSFYGENTAEQTTRLEDLPDLGLTHGDTAVCCFGSISSILDPARQAWQAFAEKQKAAGALIYYDLNTRPSIAKDPKAYRELVLQWAQIAHVVKASDSDAEWTYPGLSFEEIAKIWLDAGASMAIFTKSGAGSEVYTKNLNFSVPTRDLIAKNTVGAGDNFNAGVALAMAKINCVTKDGIAAMAKDELEEVLHYGNEMAGFHLLSIGAKPRNVKLA